MITRTAAYAMGTRFEIALAGGDEWSLRAAGEAALAEVVELDARLSLFRQGSLLSHINRAATERPVRLDGDTFSLIAAALDLCRVTEGAFDVTVAPLMRAWGFHDASSSAAGAELGGAVTGADLVELDEAAHTIRFRRRGVSLDLGGIAKGHALACAAAAVREAGVSCALIHGGTSSIAAIGAPPGEEGWRVRIGEGGDAPVAVLRDTCMSVSSPRGRMVEGAGGERLGHILDPRTGAPAEGAAELAAVIDESPVLAEGVSTAMIVLGRRPAGLPGGVTTVLRDRGGGWLVEGEKMDLVRPGRGAALAAMENP